MLGLLHLSAAFIFVFSFRAMATGSDLFQMELSNGYFESRTLAALPAENGAALVLAEVSMTIKGPTAKTSLMLYKMKEKIRGVEIVWKVPILGVHAGNGGAQSLADSPWGYVVAAQGTASAKDRGSVLLLEKETGKVIWRQWLGKTGFQMGGLSITETDIFAVGGSPVEKTASLLRFDVKTGAPTLYPLDSYAVPTALSGDRKGQHFMVVGYTPGPEGKEPYVVKLNQEKQIDWRGDFRGSTGELTGALFDGASYQLWGFVDDEATLRTYDLNATERTQTFGRVALNSGQLHNGSLYLVGNTLTGDSFGQVFQLEPGKTAVHTNFHFSSGEVIPRAAVVETMNVNEKNTLEAIVFRPTRGYLGFGTHESLIGEAHAQDKMWVLQQGASDELAKVRATKLANLKQVAAAWANAQPISFRGNNHPFSKAGSWVDKGTDGTFEFRENTYNDKIRFARNLRTGNILVFEGGIWYRVADERQDPRFLEGLRKINPFSFNYKYDLDFATDAVELRTQDESEVIFARDKRSGHLLVFVGDWYRLD